MSIDIDKIVSILKEEIKQWKTPIVTVVANRSRSPFHVLISCVLSLRTKDETTGQASARLFDLAETPAEMLTLSEEKIKKAIFPVGFYNVKAKNILSICEDLVKKYNSVVPEEIDELLKLKGVGRKTANLVVTLGYNKPGICVDTHVHRISNRFGYIKTKTPKQTEFTLRKILPPKHWIIYNDLLVTFGQNLCSPVSPFCSKCKLTQLCERVGVKKHR